MNNKVQLSQLFTIFHAISEHRSITLAAKALGLSKAHVSSSLKKLEQVLATQLVQRDSRNVHLTSAGEKLQDYSEQLDRIQHSASKAIQAMTQTPSGELTVTLPHAFADTFVAPKLTYFLQEYRNIDLKMLVTSELKNLSQEKIDVAIRLGHLLPENKIAKRLGYYQLRLCASPKYITENGQPDSATALKNCDCLSYATEPENQSWPFIINHQLTRISLSFKLQSNSSQCILETALAGGGIARLPSYVLAPYIKSGRLVPILTEFEPAAIPIYAIYDPCARDSITVAKFIQFIQKALEQAEQFT